MEVQKNISLMEGVNALQLRMLDNGYAVLDEQWRCGQVCVPYNKVYLVESGEGILYTDTQKLVMGPGMMYLVPAGCSYGYRCDGTMKKLYFHVNLLKSDGTDMLLGVGRILELPVQEGWMEALMKCYGGCGLADVLSVKEYLYKIFSAFDQAFAIAGGNNPRHSKHLEAAVLYIRNHISAALTVEEVAQSRFVSKSYLEKQFRKELGVSMGRYIDDQLMLTAKWWLEQTDRSIGDVSQALGYQDPYYFSRRFKQLCGTTPMQYRRSCRGK